MNKFSWFTMLFILCFTLSHAQEIPANKPLGDNQVSPPSTDPQNIPAIPDAYIGSTINYIRTWQPKKSFTNEADVTSADRKVSEVGRTTQYFDGLGRPLQTVAWQALPGYTDGVLDGSNRDLVSPVVYDEFGREVYKYLPYPSAESDGGFKPDPFTEQNTFYSTTYPDQQKAIYGEQVFYSKTNFEASPLNRVEKTFAPGNSWAGSEATADEHSISVQYLINDETDDVQVWNIGFDNLTYLNDDLQTNIPVRSNQPYDAGQLYKTVTTNEQKNQVIEYKDKEGHIILKKVQVGDVNESNPYTGWLLTYYVYDDLGQLRFVIPPKAVAALRENGWQFTNDITNELCFRYEYDGRQRMTAKKAPGAGWVYMVYDNRDRLILTQDANLREEDQWTYMLYDALNRIVETGITRIRTNPAETQNKQIQFEQEENEPMYPKNITGNTVSGASFTSTITVCNNFNCSNAANIPLTLTYYDEYSQSGKNYVPGYAPIIMEAWQSANDVNVYPDVLPGQPSPMTTGMVTVTRTRTLANITNFAQNDWLETASYYDDKGRVIQVNNDNYGQGTDIVTSLYDFTGKVLTTYQVHTSLITGSNQQTGIMTTMRFDEGGRLLEMRKKVNDDPASNRLIAGNRYDAMGQLCLKNLGQLRTIDPNANGTLQDKPLEGLTYSYNIRGWLKGINWTYDHSREAVSSRPTPPGPGDDDDKRNRHWFAMDLSYDWGYGHNQYNGNIAGMRWLSRGDGVQRSYGYGYDAASRLLYADFNQVSGKDANNFLQWSKQDPDGSGLQVDFSMMMGSQGSGRDAYDENGNILQMQQKGLLFSTGGASSDWIDKLDYSYNSLNNTSHTNKLSAVRDDVRHEGSLSDFTDNYDASGDDYSYDKNGNLVADNNKHIGSIIYNHLNLPAKITVNQQDGTSPKGNITYTYDAGGNKLQKVTDEFATDANRQTETITTTTYCGAFTYEGIRTVVNDRLQQTEPTTLQYISHEEGRIRILNEPSNPEDLTTKYAYDYFLKDHLGNVRMVLTDEYKKEAFPTVTFEDDALSTENTFFENVDKDRTGAVPPDFQNSSPGAKVQLLRKSSSDDNPAIGAGKLMRVMSGDKVNARVNYYTPDAAADNTDANGVATLLSSLVSILSGTTSPLPVHGAGEAVTGTLQNTPSFTGFLYDQQPSYDPNPKAYLNVMFFDEQFHFVSQGSTSLQVSVKGTGASLQLPQPVQASKNGYVYIYLSNESNNFVYFDGLQVVQQHGPLTEETHYYPFGLTMSGISSKALSFGGSENKYKYNGKELNNKEFSDNSGLELYDFGARNYDPQIGRWHTVDPKSEVSRRWSPYNYAYNNPLRFIDPDGMQAEDWVKYTDANGNKHEDYTPGALTQQQVDKLKEGGATDIQNAGQTDIVVRGDKDGVKGSYQLNADGTTTKLENGKPTTTTPDAANTEPAGASPIENTALVVGTGSEIVAKGLEQGENLANDVARVARAGSNEATQLAGVAEQAKLLGKTLKGVSAVGTAIGVGSATIQLVQNPTAGNATRLAVQGAAIAAGFIPVVGWGVSLGIGIADAVWGDDFYNWIDNH